MLEAVFSDSLAGSMKEDKSHTYGKILRKGQ